MNQFNQKLYLGHACFLMQFCSLCIIKKKFIYLKKKINEYTRTVATTIEIIYFNGGCISIVGETVRPYNAKVGSHKIEMERCRFQNLLFRNNRC